MESAKAWVRRHSNWILIVLLILAIPVVYYLSCKELLNTSKSLYVLMSVWTTCFLYWKGVTLVGQVTDSGAVSPLEGWAATVSTPPPGQNPAPSETEES